MNGNEREIKKSGRPGHISKRNTGLSQGYSDKAWFGLDCIFRAPRVVRTAVRELLASTYPRVSLLTALLGPGAGQRAVPGLFQSALCRQLTLRSQ